MRRLWPVLIIGLVLFGAGAQAQTKAEKNFLKLADEILTNLQEYWPVHATDMGIHTYDDRFTDYSSKAVLKEKRTLRDFLAQLHKFSGLSADLRIDQRLLTSNCEVAAVKLWGIQYHTKNPNLYINDAVDGIYLILSRDFAPMSQRLESIIGRMNALSEFLEQGRANLKDIPPTWLDYSRTNIDQAIAFYRSVADELQLEFPDRSGDISVASGKALAALAGFKDFLAAAVPGPVGSFAIGAEHFNHLLESEHMLKFDADSLLKIGENMLVRTRVEYDSVKAALEANGAFAAVPLFVPQHFDRQDVIDYYSWEIADIKNYLIEKDIISLPESIGRCIPRETPVFLRGIIGGIAYQPAGPFDDAKDGYFYVRPIPEEWTDAQRQGYFRAVATRSFRGSVVHEAFPGHHLQLQIAGQMQSKVRRWQMNTMFMEGWALYCEQMMPEQGLFSDKPDHWLNVLGGILFRAARIVVDVKLQTGQFTYQQAVDYMMTTLELEETSRPYIETEVRRYTMDPTQPMSYLVGKLAILDLKQRLEAKEGAAFSLKSFHDRLLAEGSIPVSLIAGKLLK